MARSFFVFLSLWLFAAASAAAQTPDGSDCRACIPGEDWLLDIQIGPAWVTDDAYNFGDYTGLDEDGLYLLGDVYGQYRDEDANYVIFEGHAFSADANMLNIEGGRQGLYELRALYQSIPRRIFDTTATPYLGNGGGQLGLPAGWVRGATTGQMTVLGDSLRPVEIERDWEILGLGFDYRPARRWKLRADYTRREQEGAKRYSGSFFFDAAEFTAPVNYETDDFEAVLSYTNETWQASLSYFGSTFDNGDDRLGWDNPYTGAADTGQLALPPDNEAHQVSLAGSMRLPARTTLNGHFSLGRLKQDEDLLAYTTNVTLNSPLSVTTADAEVDTLNLNVRAISTPWRNITVEGELRYKDFDNDTPVNVYDYVVTDTVLAAAPVSNRPYDYERRDIKLRAELRLSRGLRGDIGFDTKRFERNLQDRARTTTDRFWVRLRSRMTEITTLDVDLFTEDRGGSDYRTVDNPAAPENPLMRKYNMADREREGLRLRGTIFGPERADIGWEIEYGNDDYDNSAIGLTQSRSVRIGADFSVLLDENASLYGSFYNEKIDTDQRNSQTFALPDWAATTDDTFTTATLGMTYPDLFSIFDATLEYAWSRSIGEISNNTSGLETSFPDLRTQRQTLKLGLSYPWSYSLSFGFDFLFESFDSDDFSLEGVEPGTIPNLLALGADPWDYDTSVVYFSVRYRR